VPALATLVGAAVVSFIAVAIAKRWAVANQIMDIPNVRSSHTRPMPRAGGIGIVLTVVAASIAIILMATPAWPSVWLIIGGAIAVAAVGFIDDLRPLPARVRFGVHILAAIAAVVGGARLDSLANISLGLVGAALSVLWIVAVTNIYNFMDGIDGIAAGVAVLAGAGLGVLSWIQGDLRLALLSCAVTGAALGFLAHNFPPASVFMGDVGSGFLGYVLGTLVLLLGSSSTGGEAVISGAFVLAPFLLDGTLTLLRRVARGERWYEAHRSHYYQRLVILGYSHRAVSLFYYGLTILSVLGAVAYALFPGGPGVVLLIASLAPFMVLMFAVPRWESRPAGPAPTHS
jgi:UDP-N-acetylmuramyl pentapeptide phosphotransferase/UDP-N-acetylglucosamine-1-phosphate transferase